MQIAQVIGGYTLGGADLLRRAMGKKKPEEMAQQRDIFVAGAREERPRARQGDAALRPDGEVRRLRLQQVARRGLRAARLPDRVHEGAPRGRVHGRQPFGGDGRHRQGAPVPRGRAWPTASPILPPDVNASDYRFVPVDREHDPLRPGRGARHRRVGDRARSCDARKAAPFTRSVRLLPPRGQAHGQPARARGAGARRRVRRARREPRAPARLRRAARSRPPSRPSAQARRRRACSARPRRRAAARTSYVEAPPLGHEAEAAGGEGGARLLPLGASVHDLRARAGALSAHAARQAAPPASGCGWPASWSSARAQMTRRGRMMVVMLDDGTAQVEISVFNELFEKHREKLKEDALLVVCGKVQDDEFSGGLRVPAEELLDLDALRARYAARLKISMNGAGRCQAAAAGARRPTAPAAPAPARSWSSYGNGKATCEVVLGEAWRVRPGQQAHHRPRRLARARERRARVRHLVRPAHRAGLAARTGCGSARYQRVDQRSPRIDAPLLGEELRAAAGSRLRPGRASPPACSERRSCRRARSPRRSGCGAAGSRAPPRRAPAARRDAA